MSDSGGGSQWPGDLPPTVQQPGVQGPVTPPGGQAPTAPGTQAGPGGPGAPGGPPRYPVGGSGRTPWYKQPWPYFVAAGVVLVVALILFLVLRDDGSDKVTTTTTTSAATSTTVAATTTAAATTIATTTTIPPTTTTAATTTTATTTTTTTITPTTTTAPPSFGSGVVRVGTGAGAVPPGRYVAPNVTNCTWQRLDSPATTTTVPPPSPVNGQAIVDILPTDAYFYSAGCGTWTGYVAPAQPVNQFGEGQWVVGPAGEGQIAPGTYHTNGGPDCTWARLKAFTGEPADVIDEGQGKNPTNVTVEATDAGFTSTSCPTWTKVN